MTEDNQKIDVVLIPITAQPPTFGIIASIMDVYNHFNKIIICVKDEPIILETNYIVNLLKIVFRDEKFEVISHKIDWREVTELPMDLPYFDAIATADDRVYVNLLTKGYRCLLLPKCIGYNEFFHRQAYKRSFELEYLRLKVLPKFFKIKGIETIGEEGE